MVSGIRNLEKKLENDLDLRDRFDAIGKRLDQLAELTDDLETITDGVIT